MIPRIIIVGAGFGGLWAARGLKGAEAQVTVIDKSNHHLFQPLLYQVATAGLSPADVAVPIRYVLRKQMNAEIILDEVSGIDSANRVVLARTGPKPFDYLVVATGSLYNYFGHEDWSKFAPSLKTLTDAREIRRRILSAFEQAEVESDEKKRKDLLTFVVIGGGPTGVELAGAMAELAYRALASDFRNINPRSAKIILLEAGPRLLLTFPEGLSFKAESALQNLGVIVCTGTPVELIDAHGVVAGGERIPTSNVFWAAGVLATPAAKWLGVAADPLGRVKVNPDLSVPGNPNIFVIGDAAFVPVSPGSQQALPGVAPVAMQEGEYVARLIRKRMAGDSSSAPFHYRDKGNLATVGRAFAVADLGWLRIGGFAAWLLWVIVHIFYLIGFRNRLVVMLEWMWAYITWQRGARLIN